ncbi:MAG: ankyrin repeat domain-containing protein [Myxococcota bacterium]
MSRSTPAFGSIFRCTFSFTFRLTFGPAVGLRAPLLAAVGLAFFMFLMPSPVEAKGLAKAAKKGRAEKVAELIAAGDDVDERGRGGNTPLYFAALKGHAGVARLLLDAGADVDVDNDFGSTPMHVASRGGHVEVIRVLAEYGADLDARNLTGGSASGLRGGADNALLQTSVLKSSTPLEKAARAGEFEAVKVLIELGATLPAREAASQASLRGHKEIAAYIGRAGSKQRKKSRKTKASGGATELASSRPIEFGSGYRRKIAAVIGVSEYSRLNDLEGAKRDAREMAEVLRALGFDEVFELYDEKATRAGILELVGQKLRRETTAEDLAFVFFAGHGATEKLPGGETRGYLLPTEGSTDDPYVSGISMETVRDLSNRLAAKHVYYAVDACYSGGLVTKGAESEATRGLEKNRSVQVLTAGLDGQQAIESEGRGVFTTHLLEALRGEANVNGDAFVSASEIGWFVADQVGKSTGGRQTPAYGRLGGTGEILFPVKR